MESTDDTHVFAQAPCAALRLFVSRFLIVEFPDAHHDSHLPATGLVAAFSFRGDCRLNGGLTVPHAAITGLWDAVRTHDHSRGHAVALVQFTPIGASAFLREPLDEFFNASVALDDVLTGRASNVSRLREQMSEMKKHAERIRLLEEFVLDRVADARPDPLVSAAVSWIERAHSAGRIESLARHIGLSQSALERRFRRHVGTSPRKFASIVRLQQVLHLRAAGSDFTSIAHAAGYFDQPHFIKDFKQFTGVAPEKYFQRAAAS